MKNLHEEIFTALSTIPGVDVTYIHPDKEIVTPTISYYEIVNESVVKDKDNDILSRVAFQVDIYEPDPLVLGDLTILVNGKMHGLGFTRAFAADLYDNESKMYHKTLRYEGILDERVNLIYKNY